MKKTKYGKGKYPRTLEHNRKISIANSLTRTERKIKYAIRIFELPHYCECDKCGLITKRGCRFINGHNRGRKGKKGNNHTKEQNRKHSEFMKNQHFARGNHFNHTEEAKCNIRIHNIEYRKRHKIKFPSVGKYEAEILNKIEKAEKIKIKRQYEIKFLGYFLDGYCAETNTVYEVDENYHRYGNKQERDKKRQQEIEQHLKCRFVRINVEEYLKFGGVYER